MCKRITLSLLLLGTFIFTALAEESFAIGDLQYTIRTSAPTTVSVKRNPSITESTITSVNIPAEVTYNNVVYTVTHVSPNAFYNCSKLKDVKLPSTLLSISVNAFRECGKLPSLTIPASVAEIASNAFYYDTELTQMFFEGSVAPILNSVLSFVRSDLVLNVLSTTAKESFLNSKWRESVASDDAIVVTPIEINEAIDNSSILEQHAGHTADVVLTRTIRSEGYNSLCLPFALSAEQVQATFGDDCEIQELSSASVTSEGIDMQFTSCTAIEAGHAYLVKPKATVTNPTIQNVVLTDNVVPTETADVDFIGIFSPTAITASDNTLILGAGNTLHPTASETMNGLRGYFVLKSSCAKAAAKKQIKMSFNSANTTTDMSSVSSAQGLLIRKQIINGQLHIVRGEIHYNAQGMKIE